MKNNHITVRGLNETLANNVSSIRERHGMSISDLSRSSRLSFLTVQRINSGWRDSKNIPNLKTIAKLSRALKVEPAVLIS